MANVIFKQGTRAQYDAIAAKDVNTLYWLTDTQELFKGEVLYGKGAEATALASGLMSAADKAKLDSLASGGAIGLTAVDASVILGSDDNGTTIGVQVSKSEGNALELKEDGLFVSPVAAPSVLLRSTRLCMCTFWGSTTTAPRRVTASSSAPSRPLCLVAQMYAWSMVAITATRPMAARFST